MTAQTERVMLAMLNDASNEHYGLELAKAAGLKAGTLYPILARLEAAGWIEGSWEQIDPQVEGRRPRRYYRLTASGTSAAKRVRTDLEHLLGEKTSPLVANAGEPVAPWNTRNPRLRPS